MFIYSSSHICLHINACQFHFQSVLLNYCWIWIVLCLLVWYIDQVLQVIEKRKTLVCCLWWYVHPYSRHHVCFFLLLKTGLGHFFNKLDWELLSKLLASRITLNFGDFCYLMKISWDFVLELKLRTSVVPLTFTAKFLKMTVR